MHAQPKSFALDMSDFEEEYNNLLEISNETGSLLKPSNVRHFFCAVHALVHTLGAHTLVAHTRVAHTLVEHTLVAHTLVEHTLVEHTLVERTLVEHSLLNTHLLNTRFLKNTC